MKRNFILVLLLCSLFSFSGFSQITHNGKLDNIEEFSHLVIDSIVMPDGIKLLTDIFIPVLQDCLLVTVNTADIPLINQIPGIDPVLNLELIRRGTQLFLYDSLNGQPNPNPFQLPFILTRTPYDKEGGEIGRIMSVMGYAYAMQDMRGRYSSEGVYLPMYSDSWNKNGDHPEVKHILDLTDVTDARNANKHEDGYWSIDYIAKKLKRNYDLFGDGSEYAMIDTTVPGWDLFCNGSIGMLGASALGNTQYQAAAAHRIDPNEKGLKCLFPIVATLEHFKYTAYQNGVFRDRIVTGWIRGQIFDVEDELIDIDIDMQDNIHTSADWGKANKFDAANSAIDHFVNQQYGEYASYYPNSGLRGDMDATFSPVDINGESVTDALHEDGHTGLQGPVPDRNFSRYTNMEVPAYHLTGWWDIFTDGQIETWRQMMTHLRDDLGNKKLQKLIIGPWAHQTVGSSVSGDVIYKENIADILGFDLAEVDFEDLEIAKILESELLSWFRYNLNYNKVANIGLPSVRIPKSNTMQSIGGGFEILVPAEDYRMTFEEFINLLIGAQDLPSVPVQIYNPLTQTTSNLTLDIPAFSEPLLPEFSGTTLNTKIDSIDYTQVPNVRFYVIGPLDDDLPENNELGNYWFASDSFPIIDNIKWETMYLHRDGQLNYSAPTVDEGFSIYVHDPNDPVRTHGGGNMIVNTPDGDHDSQGQMDFSDPRYADDVIDRGGIVHYEYEVTQDSFCLLGYPKVKLYAKTNPGGLQDGPTDTDFFVRVLDVYPDGRELFVVEGAINARARDYSRALVDLIETKAESEIPFTNIEIGEVIEYEFVMMPIAYTFGKGHKIKILISSSNYNRYQVNANLPLNHGEFFRRKPDDGKTYIFDGVEMEPRIAVQRIGHSPAYPTQITFPVHDKSYTSVRNNASSGFDLDALVFPNPSNDVVNLYMNSASNYTVKITNANGKQIHNEEFYDFTTLDVTNYPKGFYMAEVTDLDTEKSVVKKISVQ